MLTENVAPSRLTHRRYRGAWVLRRTGPQPLAPGKRIKRAASLRRRAERYRARAAVLVAAAELLEARALDVAPVVDPLAGE